METYDIVMLVVLIGATLFGAIKGFAWQLASIGSIVVSYMVAYNFREPFSESIQAEPPWNRFLAMLILYVGTSLIIWVAFRMVSRSIDRLKLREFDRQVGALFGLGKGALYCTLITLFAVTLLGDGVREKIVASKSGRYISKALDRSEAVIPVEIHGVVQPYLEKFDERIKGDSPGQQLIPTWAADRAPDLRLGDGLWNGSSGPEGQQPLPFEPGAAHPQPSAEWPSAQWPSAEAPQWPANPPAQQYPTSPADEGRYQQAQQPPWRDYQ